MAAPRHGAAHRTLAAHAFVDPTALFAHNLSDSVMIESSYVRTEYPRLCNMRFADIDQFRHATKELMGAQLNIKM